MDPFSSFMTKKLGGKYVGPAERRGGRKREETPEAGADLDLDQDPGSSDSSASNTKQANNHSTIPLPTRSDQILKLAKKKNENIIREGRNIKTKEGSFFRLDNVHEENDVEVENETIDTDITNSQIQKEHVPETETENNTTEVTQGKTNKRRTSKEVRKDPSKPRVRSTARAHQSWNERYLTNKKKIYTLQSDHNLPPDFIYAVKNNMHNPNVRGAAKTAGKYMVYGRGDLVRKFMKDGVKYDKKNCYIMANASDLSELVPQLEYKTSDEESDEEEVVSPLTEKERKRRRREDRDREDSPDADIFNMRAGALSVRTPGS